MGDMVVPALVCGLDTWPVVRRQDTLPSQCLSHPGVEMDAGFLSPGENLDQFLLGLSFVRYNVRAARYLRITDVVKSDSGNFSCVASNSYGTANCTVRLIVEGYFNPMRLRFLEEFNVNVI